MHSSYKILLVDDEKDNLELLTDYLEEDYEVFSTTNAEDALQLIAQYIFDAIILDINMPGMNGLELCSVIKTKKTYKDIPIIFLSGLSDMEKIEQGFKNGAVDYMIKPFNLQELTIRLATHIKVSKKYIELFEEQIKLNNQIHSLTQELIETKNNILLKEEHFSNREDNFSSNNERIIENKKRSEDFNIKALQIQEKLQRQKELLEKTKKMLG